MVQVKGGDFFFFLSMDSFLTEGEKVIQIPFPIHAFATFSLYIPFSPYIPLSFPTLKYFWNKYVKWRKLYLA